MDRDRAYIYVNQHDTLDTEKLICFCHRGTLNLTKLSGKFAKCIRIS